MKNIKRLEKMQIYNDEVNVSMSIKAPEVSFKGKSLAARTDYKVDALCQEKNRYIYKRWLFIVDYW